MKEKKRMRNRKYQKQCKHRKTAIVESEKSRYQFKNKKWKNAVN